jgi:aldose 1-epimerase
VSFDLTGPGREGLKAAFNPDANLVVNSLTIGGRELLEQNDGLRGYLDHGTTMGIPLLHPWANRLDGLSYAAAGTRVALERQKALFNRDPAGLPIHGALPRLLRWEVLATTVGDDGAFMHARLDWHPGHPAFALFPYPHELEYRARVEERRIEITVTLAPTESQPVPVSFGFHPYLRIPGRSRMDVEMTLPGSRRLVLDGSMIPTGATEPLEPGRRRLSDTTWDDGFRDLDERPRFALSDGESELSLTFLRGFPFAQVYAPPGSDFVCFEPMTAPTNALVSGGPDLPVVAPGERYEAAFELAVAP